MTQTWRLIPMTSSDPTLDMVCVPDCRFIEQHIRSILVKCPHFPAGYGDVHTLEVPLVLLSPSHYTPAIGGDPGPMVVMKRFVAAHGITETTDEFPEIIPEEDEAEA